MNHLFLQSVALLATVMVAYSAPATSQLQKDKERLTNIMRELGDTVNSLEKDITDAAKRAEEEPIVEAEISEDETRAKQRGYKDNYRNNGRPEGNMELEDDIEVLRGRPEVQTGLEDEKEEVEVNGESRLREVLRMLLQLENTKKSNTDDTAEDNHDFPMPLVK